MKTEAAPVKAFALAHGLAVAQPRGLRLDGRFADDAAAARAALLAAAPEAIVVAAYGLILPPWLLALPRLGCINIHASLLPRWRGAAPIQRAIEAGDAETGVTLMQMDAGLDTGADPADRGDADRRRRHQRHPAAAPGGPRRRAGGARPGRGRRRPAAAAAAAGGRRHLRRQDRQGRGDDRLAPAGGGDRAAPARLRSVSRCAQPPRRARRSPAGAARSARFRPAPPRPARSSPPADGAITVACGEGALALLELQRPGGRRMAAAEFLRGRPPAPGARFELPAAPDEPGRAGARLNSGPPDPSIAVRRSGALPPKARAKCSTC